MSNAITIDQIVEVLESAGCVVKEWSGKGARRVYVSKTPNGSKGDYGYCEEGDDINDVVRHISKRQGEIAAILRA